MKKLWFGLCAITLLLTGCRSVSVLSFDVWRPAKITFPVEIERVTVVNNSEDPDERIGNRYEDISNREYTLVVPHDSTSYRLAEYIAVALSDAHYFPEITIFYDDSITLPKSLYPLLSEFQLATIRGGTDHTAVISLDKTDMAVTMKDNAFVGTSGETIFVTDLSVATTLHLRVYWPDKALPSYEMVSDTVYWQSYGYTPDEAHESLPQSGEFVHEAMRRVSSNVRNTFIPHVESVTRYIYTSINPAMADAYDFWQQNKYKEASYLWEYVYEEQKNATTRAMAAANLAIYNELFDKYGEAIAWVDKALSLLMEKADSDSGEIAVLQDYRRQLVERNTANPALQQQM